MLKNKKAESGMGMSLGAIARIVLAIAALALVFVACGKVREVFYSSDAKSFEAFVDGINEMSSDRIDPFALQLNENSAVVGFTNGADEYAYVKTFDLDLKLTKPTNNDECNENACICLCDGGFKYGLVNIECGSDFLCKKLNVNIVDETKIDTPLESHWKNGFLFARYNLRGEPLGANGLRTYDGKFISLYVEKGGDTIGVCNEDMRNYNKGKLGVDGCINKGIIP